MNCYFLLFYLSQIQHQQKSMGTQYSKQEERQTVIQNFHGGCKSQNSIKSKTTFHYIHPLECQADDNLNLEDDTVEIDEHTQQQQYWEIQNDSQQYPTTSMKDMEKIDEIKVKWNTFIKMKKKNYLEDYSVLKQIGRGGFGCVHKVKARYTGIYRAAKRIKKAQLKKSQYQKLFQEMAIMISLDHPNIAKLYQVYDYKSYYVLILQLCEGGQLFKKIVTKQMNEQSSAKVMKQIMRTLIYLHKSGIVHRDLKPQNMLFEADSDTIKLIDFGIAIRRKPDQILTSRLGTPYYIAPQVLCKSYGQKCDIWSAGVILFMMIAGYPPFRGQNEYQVMENVLKQNINFKGAIWTKVSAQCRQVISMMLKKNPEQRPSALQCFHHPWIARVVEKSLTETKDKKVISNIRSFSFQNKLQAVVYTYIVSQLLSSQQKRFLFETFKQLDKNNDGVIESEQLRQALKSKKQISQERLVFLMRIIDTNGSGHIDYTEFLVAGINPKDHLTQQHFQQAFQYFDIDHSGAITFQQIAHFLQDTKQSQESIKKIFRQVDENNDGNISKEQFVKLLMQETSKKLNSLSQLNDANKQIEKKLPSNKTGKTIKNDQTLQKRQKIQAILNNNAKSQMYFFNEKVSSVQVKDQKPVNSQLTKGTKTVQKKPSRPDQKKKSTKVILKKKQHNQSKPAQEKQNHLPTKIQQKPKSSLSQPKLKQRDNPKHKKVVIKA